MMLLRRDACGGQHFCARKLRTRRRNKSLETGKPMAADVFDGVLQAVQQSAGPHQSAVDEIIGGCSVNSISRGTRAAIVVDPSGKRGLRARISFLLSRTDV